MRGAEALAAALRAGTDRVYTVPGYPITELGELAGAEMVINEKTALEYALGDSLTGKRAAVIVKNVGVNACADPLCEATVQGLIGGVVLVAGDDPKAKGSQTAQDSRYYGELAEIPVIEPDASSCYTGVEAALTASEAFSRVAMIRLTPELMEAEASGHPLTPDKRERPARRSGLDNARPGNGGRIPLPVHAGMGFNLSPQPLGGGNAWSRAGARCGQDRDGLPATGPNCRSRKDKRDRPAVCPRPPCSIPARRAGAAGIKG